MCVSIQLTVAHSLSLSLVEQVFLYFRPDGNSFFYELKANYLAKMVGYKTHKMKWNSHICLVEKPFNHCMFCRLCLSMLSGSVHSIGSNWFELQELEFSPKWRDSFSQIFCFTISRPRYKGFSSFSITTKSKFHFRETADHSNLFIDKFIIDLNISTNKQCYYLLPSHFYWKLR